MAKNGDRLSFRDAVRVEENGHEEEEALLPDEEQQDATSNEDESRSSDSLPVYMTIHK